MNNIMDIIEETACRTYIEHKAKSLKPLVNEVVSATDRYNNSPSIATGSAKYDATKQLHEAIQKIAEDVYERWNISSDEFKKIIDNINYGG